MSLLTMVSKAFRSDIPIDSPEIQGVETDVAQAYKQYQKLAKKEAVKKSKLSRLNSEVQQLEAEKNGVKDRINTFFAKERHLPLIEVLKFVNLYKEGFADAPEGKIEELLIKYTKSLPIYGEKDYMDAYAKLTEDGLLLVSPVQFSDNSGVPIRMRSGV